ncbi:hypothetical protein Anas_08805 [Armadillidium nasatum]|uniref:Uncharacterized protein n=1 Tax=Armadillidium nasatum TaxID=96803 RepID=A0A5N5TKI0_9CRUS|nr:hypothetical protein Anas_08805 [Armadillidium nasatum]
MQDLLFEVLGKLNNLGKGMDKRYQSECQTHATSVGPGFINTKTNLTRLESTFILEVFGHKYFLFFSPKFDILKQ